MALTRYKQGNETDSLEIDTPDDVSGASLKNFRFQRPDGTTVDVAASYSTDGTDGKLKVVTSATFNFNQAGHWKVEAYIEKGAAKLGTLPADFFVVARLATPAP